ncbi:MAG: AAA family ATPase [Planctomycetaceae bacterium]
MIDFVNPHPSNQQPGGEVDGAAHRSRSGVPATSRSGTRRGGESHFDWRVLVRSLRRRWFICLLTGIPVGSAAAFAAWSFVPAPFKAGRDLYVKSFDDQLVFQTREIQAEFRVRKQTAQRQVTSPEVLTVAIRDPAVASSATLGEVENPVEWLAENLNVSESGTEFFTISLSGERPEELARIVNAVTDAFWDEVVMGARTDRADRLVEIEKISQQVNRELDALRRQLVGLTEKSHTSTMVMAEQKQNSLLQQLVNLRQNLGEVEMELLKAEVNREVDGKSGDGPPLELPEGVLDAYVAQSPEYQELSARIDQLRNLVQRNQETLSPTHRSVAESKRKLADAEKERENLRVTLAPRIVEQIRRESSAAAAMSAEQRDDEITRLKLLKESLTAELEKIKIEEKDTGILGLELENLDKQIERKELMAATIEEEIERRKLEMRADLYPIVKLQPAQAPTKRDMKQRMSATGVAGLGGFGLIVAGIVLLDSLRRRISSVKEVSGELSVRLIGSIPAMPRSAMDAPVHGRRSEKTVFWQNALKESIDAARILLLTEAERSDLQVLMIGSAVSSEGKTTLTCHLATSLARSGRSVVLMDCDLRRPTIDQVFGLDPEPGVSELLRGEVDLEAVVRPAGPPGLFAITAGISDATAHERFLGGDLDPIIAALREQFDFLLIDTPPVLPVCDALVVARSVDAVMMAVRRDVSRLEKVAAAIARFAAVGIPVLGAVTIGLDDDPVGYGGYYRSRRRYGYAPEYLLTNNGSAAECRSGTR